jgi:hypothetical protein
MPRSEPVGRRRGNRAGVDYPEEVPLSAGPTQFAELNEVLGRLVDGASRALGDTFVGAYLLGSFALGDADIHSDCDFIVATSGPIRPAQEEMIRRLHERFPAEDGYWNKHLEGSYAPIGDLRRLDVLGLDWLFIDHGHAEMEWSAHCNSLEHRWTLRHHGVVLTGPSPDDFAEVPSSLLRERMRSQIPGFMAELATWIGIEDIAWAQRYAVTTLCRMLFTVRHGTLASKRRALQWAAEDLDARWRGLVLRAEQERVRGWDPGDLPERELVEQTRQFADYATLRVLSSAEDMS